MRSFVIAIFLASTSAVRMTWPSVARCPEGQESTDEWACDNNAKGPHSLNKPTGFLQLRQQWPSVARCAEDQISNDETPCDHNSKGFRTLDHTEDVQLNRDPLLTWAPTPKKTHPMNYPVPNFGVDNDINDSQAHEAAAGASMGHTWTPTKDEDDKWVLPSPAIEFKLAQSINRKI